MANFCENCGTKLTPGAAFCPECGAKIEQSVPGTAQPRQNQPAQAQPVNQRPGYNYAAPKQAQQAQYQQSPQQPQYQQPQPQQAQYQQPPQQPRYQQPQQQPQYQQPQQQYGQPQPQYQYQQSGNRQTSGQKHKNSFVILTVFLAVIMAIEGVIACFWYPGFFRKDSGGNTVNSGNNTITIDGEEYSLPPALEDIELDYTDKEKENAPAVEMSVSPDSPTASSDGISVDFGGYNLGGDDTFIVKTLPVHDHKNEGYYLKGYDMSLASGTDQFATEVTVTIPRDESDGDFVQFITKDPETGENEEVYYEISEDGKSYILYKTHFSETDMMVPSAFGKNFTEAVKAGDVSDISTREALSSFYYTSYVNWKSRMTAPVAYSSYELWSKMHNKYTYLPEADALLKAMEAQIKAEGIESIDFSAPLFEDTKKILDKTDIANNTKGTVEGTKKVLESLGLDEISPGAKKALEAGKEASKEGADLLGKACAAYSIIATAIGIINLNDKINIEISKGKYETEEEAYKEHFLEYIGSITGIVGTAATLVGLLVAGAAAGTAGAFVGTTAAIIGGICSLAGLILYFVSEDKKEPNEDLSTQEVNYRDYYALTSSKQGYRTFYIGTKKEFAVDSDIKNGSIGVIKPLKDSVTDEQSRQFTETVNKHMAQINKTGGFLGVEPRSGITRDFASVCRVLFDLLKDTPDKIEPAFTEFFQNYADACFENLNDSEFMSLSKQAMAQRGYTGSASLPWENKDEKEIVKSKYSARFVKELWSSCSELFHFLSTTAQHEAQTAVDKSIREEVLPLLNTQMEFSVEDDSLDDPKDLTQSVYNADKVSTGIATDYKAPDGETYINNYKYNYDYPITFRVKDKDGEYQRLDVPMFMPSQSYSKSEKDAGFNLFKAQYVDYYPNYDNFIPYRRDKTGNVVFRCTYFHWLMMGAPTAMAFKDVSNKNNKADIKDFEIPAPDEDGVMRIKLNVASEIKPDETYKVKIKYDGTVHYYDNSYQNPLSDDATVEISKGKNIKISLPAAAFSEKWGENRIKKRGEITLSGKIDDESKENNGKVTLYGHLTEIPSITGTQITEASEYTDTDVYSLSSPKIGNSYTQDDDKISKIPYSVFTVEIDKNENDIRLMQIKIVGNWDCKHTTTGAGNSRQETKEYKSIALGNTKGFTYNYLTDD